MRSVGESGPAAMSDRPDPDVESFLLLLAARRSPRTVDAYRRDLAACAASLDGPVGRATTEELEAWLAAMRADGRAGSTIARRLAAVRSYLRHLTLIGVRADNPAAGIAGPRRPRTVPRTLSPAEAERLVDAANGTTPRSMRDKALVELLYGAGLRVSEALGLSRASIDLDARIVRVIGKGGKERLVPLGRPADGGGAPLPRARATASRPATPSRPLPQRPRRRADARRRVPDPAPARRAGRSRAGPRPPAPPAPLVRHPPARGRCRPAKRPGDARARRRRDDRALHPRLRPPPPRRVLPRTSARASPHGAGSRRGLTPTPRARAPARPSPRPGRRA